MSASAAFHSLKTRNSENPTQYNGSMSYRVHDNSNSNSNQYFDNVGQTLDDFDLEESLASD